MKKLDFENDVKLELKRLSKEMGFKISSDRKLDRMLLDYLNVHSKLISSKKRFFRANPKFVNDMFFHPKREVIEHICHLARTGGDLNPFQSERLFQTGRHDHLRNEWNIFHFHLSMEKMRKSNFVRRGELLLFAYIDDNQIIFLGVDKHEAFADIKWLKILHEHFKEVLEPFRIEDNVDLKVLYPSERHELWHERLALGFIRIEDTVYQHPGMGQTTSGHNIIQVQNSHSYLRWIYTLREQVEKDYKELCASIGASMDTAEFKIVIGHTTFELIEETQKIRILHFPNLLKPLK